MEKNRMTQHMDITIVILTYNTLDLTLACLSSIQRCSWGRYSHEVIVVDNASGDGTALVVKKQFPDSIVIKNSKNMGFAVGNNIGIKKARGRYIVLLNSDTEVHPLVFTSMIEFMDKHELAGASTCRLLLPDGSMDPACHRGFPTPWNAFCYYTKLEKLFPKTKAFGGYHQGYKDLTIAHEVDVISGAFFMIRKDIIHHVGILDEAYFMYAEDIDYAYRIKEAGYEIWFNPTLSVLHRKKQSGRMHADRARRIQSYKYFLTCNRLFYAKHYEQKYNPFVTYLVYLGFDIQLLAVRLLGITV